MAKKENFEFGSVLYTPSGIGISDIVDRKTNNKWVSWGEDNKLPYILWDNYLKNSTLSSIVNSMVDYIMGEGVECSINVPDLQKTIFDFILFGGFALEGIRNKKGDVVLLNYINVMNVRVDEKLTTAYISNKWKGYTGDNIITLPLFNNKEKQPHFIYYFRGNLTRGINPIPCYISAFKSILILNNTREFHIKNLENGFSASSLISINNGTIKRKELEDIQQKLEYNYQGSVNAGKVIIINAPDKEHAPTIQRLQADDFGDQYFALQDSSINDLYTAFRINPVLLGVNVPTGFSAVEYENIFKLYNKTVIKPLQKNIIKAFNDMGVDLSFTDFKIDFN